MHVFDGQIIYIFCLKSTATESATVLVPDQKEKSYLVIRIFTFIKPCMSVHHIFSQILKLNQPIRISHLSSYQAN